MSESSSRSCLQTSLAPRPLVSSSIQSAARSCSRSRSHSTSTQCSSSRSRRSAIGMRWTRRLRERRRTEYESSGCLRPSSRRRRCAWRLGLTRVRHVRPSNGPSPNTSYSPCLSKRRRCANSSLVSLDGTPRSRHLSGLRTLRAVWLDLDHPAHCHAAAAKRGKPARREIEVSA